ncbi:Heat shock protein 12B [Tetrabaena socialis]|uniref:Heat shock protein 12B n=1 Tax=Tetrabaena socialis TaxID=47790 RepID=A0A2J8AH18_9CHLO|nr:Heat shock protein 12B [Tetrabaena socialis]|eukprot:PNH11786.1 Heat shock protein 12B [Tetrabaena socialis]
MSLPVATSPSAAAGAAPPSLVVGIDFGTHASGFAFRKHGSAAAGAGPVRVSTHDRWPDQPTPDAKTRTALLYQGTRVVAWGWTAWKRWSELPASERQRQSYSYLENFKLLLEDGAEADVDTVCPLPAGVTRVQAVADYLAEMRAYIREHLRRTTGVAMSSDEVLWCLTLPAIWSNAAKARMRDAAHSAGLTVRLDSRSLLLTLEPEAAAVSAVMTAEAAPPGAALRGVDGSTAGAQLRSGDVVLVLDCGGGTADATLHHVRGSGSATRLEEAAIGKGALAGGAHVDAAAWRYVRELLGPSQWDSWSATADPKQMTGLKTKLELAKRAFRGVQAADADRVAAGSFRRLITTAGAQRNDVRLPLPQGLVDRLGAHTLRAVGSAARGSINAQNELVLPAAVAGEQIFDPVVSKVVDLAAEVINDGRRLGNNCNKVLLAGGFARSPYLQSRVRNALPAGIQLLIQSDPGAAVVTGAVLFGGLPSVVSARRSRLGYGVHSALPWSAGDAAHAAKYGFPQQYGAWALGGYFSFVEPGDLVGYDQVVKHPFVPIYRTQTSVPFELYVTPNGSARYVRDPDMRRLAEVELPLPPNWAAQVVGTDYIVEAEMRYGATEITMVASDHRTKDAVAIGVAWAV